MKILAVIPARYASTRFPGKPLALIRGKTMIQRVYEQVKKASLITDIVVATDDNRIARKVDQFDGNFIMTSATHPSGTDRCFEALSKHHKSFDAVINVQGDEPFIAPEQIDQLAQLIKPENIGIATLIQRIRDISHLFDPNVVKAITNQEGKALYFSRQAIPYLQNFEKEQWLKEHVFYRHIGIYAYKSDVLQQITNMPPSPLEKAESLEQLRWLEHGITIQTALTDHAQFGVDTPADLEKLINKI
ncbi:MAG: 3-deoxy-manno-octulosonate cytidylyltransferase [Bacteroidales bacterium]|jgi:3-deoxy-manno-octulosonate cytidylyltransferase (CMP-KDO synthetase)|nr:3-deoxy-manno-octulosonate cytidylyltransferase [Bacteroidales bacterium]MDN5349563.1 3-deoxy-manno-octulosonate cytidylyltransferase synthetase [Bacteroidales bacterium]